MHTVLLWLHILLMVGAFGGVCLSHFALPKDLRTSETVMRATFKMASLLIIGGFVAGFVLFYLRVKPIADVDGDLSGAGAGMIIVKMALWLVVAGCLMTGSGKARAGNTGAAHTLRFVSIVLMAIAAYLGVGA